MDRRDKVPPCPLYVNYHGDPSWHLTANEQELRLYNKMEDDYGKLWGRAPGTFEEVRK